MRIALRNPWTVNTSRTLTILLILYDAAGAGVVLGSAIVGALIFLATARHGDLGSALAVGLLNFVGYLPIFLFSVYGGTLADRFDRRRLLLFAQIALVVVASGVRPGEVRAPAVRWRVTSKLSKR